jgi:hypothetical protein
MKRSKKIQLLLVTAILASCNRVIIPGETMAAYAPDPNRTAAPADSSLIATPAFNDSWYNCTCQLDDAYYNYFSFYYTGHPWLPLYRPGHFYRRQAFWKNHQFTIKGGFGRGAASTGS